MYISIPVPILSGKLSYILQQKSKIVATQRDKDFYLTMHDHRDRILSSPF